MKLEIIEMWIWLEHKHFNVTLTSCHLDPDISCVLLSSYNNIICQLQGNEDTLIHSQYLESQIYLKVPKRTQGQ